MFHAEMRGGLFQIQFGIGGNDRDIVSALPVLPHQGLGDELGRNPPDLGGMECADVPVRGITRGFVSYPGAVQQSHRVSLGSFHRD